MIEGITHALVARGVVILAEYSITSADYTIVTGPILQSMAYHRITEDDQRPRIFIHGTQHRIHALPKRGLVFLAVAESAFPSHPVNLMLESLSRRFLEIYGDGWEMPLITIPFSMIEFSNEIKVVVDECNGAVRTRLEFTPPALGNMASADLGIYDPLIEESREELGRVQDVLVINMEKLLTRGERLQELQADSERLNQVAIEFQRRSLFLRRKMWWKNKDFIIILTVIVVCVLYLLLGAIKGIRVASDTK